MSMHTRISVDQTLHGTASLQIHPGLPRIQRIDEFDAAKEGSRELAAHNIGAKERGALLLLLWMQVLSKLLGAQKLSDAIGNITCRIDDEERSAAPSSAAAGAPEAGEGTISTAEKQLRAIQKKLRQCEALQVSLLVAGHAGSLRLLPLVQHGLHLLAVQSPAPVMQAQHALHACFMQKRCRLLVS